MKIRRRFIQTITLEERLADEANALETKQKSFLQGRSRQSFYERLAKTKW
jgi:hypothetical protein